MPKPRYRQIFPEITPYYHCISRCVRRAHLCGFDQQSGRNFGHRKAWIERRILYLAGIFAIDVAAYAVMSNHYHVVLHIDTRRARGWSDTEVIRRWGRLFRLPRSVRVRLEPHGGLPGNVEVHGFVAKWRRRLSSISWFMRLINEPLARLANEEDDCTGRFWEGRFKSQALVGRRAVLACMTYVDLNPVRAGLARAPEQSQRTSIKARIEGSIQLMPFSDELAADGRSTLPASRCEYLDLVDWSGRLVLTGKSGSIPSRAPPILDRIGASAIWSHLVLDFQALTGPVAGTAHQLSKICQRLGNRWLRCRPLEHLPVQR